MRTSRCCVSGQRPGHLVAGVVRRRSGITLIEVIASALLMATLLVGVLMSFGRHQRQLNMVVDKQRAILAMDHLMMDWFASDSRFPVGQSGACKSESDLFWTSEAVGQFLFAGKLDAVTIKVDIYSTLNPGQSLVSLEIVDQMPSLQTNDGL